MTAQNTNQAGQRSMSLPGGISLSRVEAPQSFPSKKSRDRSRGALSCSTASTASGSQSRFSLLNSSPRESLVTRSLDFNRLRLSAQSLLDDRKSGHPSTPRLELPGRQTSSSSLGLPPATPDSTVATLRTEDPWDQIFKASSDHESSPRHNFTDVETMSCRSFYAGSDLTPVKELPVGLEEPDMIEIIMENAERGDRSPPFRSPSVRGSRFSTLSTLHSFRSSSSPPESESGSPNRFSRASSVRSLRTPLRNSLTRSPSPTPRRLSTTLGAIVENSFEKILQATEEGTSNSPKMACVNDFSYAAAPSLDVIEETSPIIEEAQSPIESHDIEHFALEPSSCEGIERGFAEISLNIEEEMPKLSPRGSRLCSIQEDEEE